MIIQHIALSCSTFLLVLVPMRQSCSSSSFRLMKIFYRVVIPRVVDHSRSTPPNSGRTRRCDTLSRLNQTGTQGKQDRERHRTASGKALVTPFQQYWSDSMPGSEGGRNANRRRHDLVSPRVCACAVTVDLANREGQAYQKLKTGTTSSAELCLRLCLST